jgi:mannan endo-1,6-alpha-mannosidase
MHFTKTSLASALLLASNTLAIELDLNDPQSIKDAAETVASSIVDRYRNSSIPGLFGDVGDPYWFWESGLAWDSLLHYWHQTGDDAHNEIIGEALRFQLSPSIDYAPANQTKGLTNDDQTSWALAAMTAAEYGFPSDVLDDLNTTWVQTATNVFDVQALRWDAETCNGGIRWQIFSFNNGYNYKNTMTNGNFFQLANRLALYTGNSTYADWATRMYDWTVDVGIISNDGRIFDGTDADINCTDLNHVQWTANAGTFLAGQAYAYNAVSPLLCLHKPAHKVHPTNTKPPTDPHQQQPSLHPRRRRHKRHLRLFRLGRLHHPQRHPHRNRLRGPQKLQHRRPRLPRDPRPRPLRHPRPDARRRNDLDTVRR